MQEAPPIARWMTGKRYDEVWWWVHHKSGSAHWVTVGV